MNSEETKEEKEIRKISEGQNPYSKSCPNRHLWSEGFRYAYSQLKILQKVSILHEETCDGCGCHKATRQSHLDSQWLPLSKSPDDGAYHLVAWELPHPDETKPNIKGVSVGIFDCLEKKEWYQDKNGFRVPIKGATEWMPFPTRSK